MSEGAKLTRFEVRVVVHGFLASFIMIFMVSSAHGSMYHKYERGQPGDVILEGYHFLVKEWEPLVLFFGFSDDYDDCEELMDLWNRTEALTMKFRCTRIE